MITAPLVRLRDTSSRDSRTALKPMTATGELDSHDTLNTGQQLLTLSLAPRTGSPALQTLIKVPRTPQRGELHSLPLFIHLRPPPNTPSLPPSLLFSDIPSAFSSEASSSYSSQSWLDGGSQSSPPPVDLRGLSTSAQSRG